MSVSVVHGDCREVAKQIFHGLLAESALYPFDFAFLDPPFNIGHNYIEYKDNINGQEFEQLVRGAAVAAHTLLRVGGVLALHGPDHLADIYLTLAKELKWQRVAWVNWFYAFGQCRTSNWVDSRCHCLIYVKEGGEYTWNPTDVMRPSARATTYGDKRTQASATPGVRVPGTVWGVPDDGPYWGRVQGNNAERVPEVPNQLPEVYIERLLRAYTDPGDSVLDMFGGSGTVPVVAQALKRNCVSSDVCAENVKLIEQRLGRGACRVQFKKGGADGQIAGG